MLVFRLAKDNLPLAQGNKFQLYAIEEFLN